MTTLEREHRFELQYQLSPVTRNNDTTFSHSRSTSSNSTHTTLATPPSTLSSYGSMLSTSQSPCLTQLSPPDATTMTTASPSRHTANVSIQTMSTVVKIMVCYFPLPSPPPSSSHSPPSFRQTRTTVVCYFVSKLQINQQRKLAKEDQ
jgi:hypothetical protein